MNKYHIYWMSLFVAMFVTIGCTHGEDYDLVEEFKSATNIYYMRTSIEAREALTNFIKRTEERSETVSSNQEADYKKLLDMSWLRLASVYQFEGKDDEYIIAMERAIYYFDQDANISADPRYKLDKFAALTVYLKEIEEARLPVWKKE